MQIGIVADDLTGAADAVAPFAQGGLNADLAYVVRGKLRCAPAASDARAWDTETRALPPERSLVISRLLRAATRRLKACAPWLYYKKIDSTLRGHLRLELDAMRRELPGRLAIVCPAFPANGRIVVNGILVIYGAPQEGPGRGQTVREAFQAGEDDLAAELPLAFIRQGVESVSQRFLQMAGQGIETIFCDAVLQSDLEILARVILRHPSRYLPVGSAGLASALAAWAPQVAGGPRPNLAVETAAAKARRGAASSALPAPTPSSEASIFASGNVLVVVGSLNPVSRKQAAYLAARAGIQPTVLDPARGIEGVEAALERLEAQWRSGQRIGLLLTCELPTRDGIASYLHMCALCLYKHAGSCPIDGLIVTGGETAVQFLRGFDAVGMRIAGEIRPGIVHGSVVSADGANKKGFESLPMITKAGGFGTEETLARCVGL